MENSRLARFSHLCTVALGLAVFFYVGVKFLIPAVLPILIALAVSSITRPIARWSAKKSKMPQKFCGILFSALFIFFAAYSVVVLGEKLIHEMMSALGVLMESLEREDNIIRRGMDFMLNLRDRIPLLSAPDSTYVANLYDMIINWAKSAAVTASESFAKAAAGFIATLPRLVFASVVCVIALFYFTADMDSIRTAVSRFLPKSMKQRTDELSKKLGHGTSAYVKAYLALMALTFGELLLGFVLLRVRYAFFLALLVAVIDILPVLGVGTVLLPWALFLFLSGSTARGVGMLVLFAVMYAVRQFAEPRLVGRFMGLHPIFTLGGAFAGYYLFGLWGILLSPVILYSIKLAFGDKTDG